MPTVRAAAVQYEHADGDVRANLGTVRAFVEEAALGNVDIIAFPECCLTGYWFLRNLTRRELEAIAEPVPDGPSSRELLKMSWESGMTIGAGLVEIDGEGDIYNSYVVALPDGRLVWHRKLHCFINEHMVSGSEYTVFDAPQGFRAGVLTCYDNNIGENVRMNALYGVEVLMAPHQTGGCKTSSPYAMGLIDPKLWEERETNPDAIEAEFRGDKGRGWLMRWLPARAHDNGLFLLFSNGVGRDGDEIRTGNAMILDPYGRILAETWKAGNDMVVADLDLTLIPKSTGRRWIRTRRPELYGLLAHRTGIEEDTRKVRFEKE